jgi:hypothetical protein
MPTNDDAKLGKLFDNSLRKMMENVTNQLKTATSAESKGLVAVLAKRELLSLLTK